MLPVLLGQYLDKSLLLVVCSTFFRIVGRLIHYFFLFAEPSLQLLLAFLVVVSFDQVFVHTGYEILNNCLILLQGEVHDILSFFSSSADEAKDWVVVLLERKMCISC